MGEEELLPPPPKKQGTSTEQTEGAGELLPPPPKKKESTTSTTSVSSEPVSQPTTPSSTSGATFDPEGEGYDYETAKNYGIKSDESGHWQSRIELPKSETQRLNIPEHSGIILKGVKHPTYSKTIKGEDEAGFKIVKIGSRYYSVPKDYLPPIILTEETYQQGQAKGDVIKQPLRDEASLQKAQKEAAQAGAIQEGRKLEADISKQLKDKTEKEKQLGVKEKLLRYLKNLTGQEPSTGEVTVTETELPEDNTPIDAFKPFELEIESLQPSTVREEGTDPQLYQRVVMKNTKLQKAIQKEREELTPYLQNVKTVSDARRLLGQTSGEYSSLVTSLQEDETKLKEDYTRARQLNQDKLNELGFFDSFGEGIKQTTEANEVANALYADNDERFGELLEKNYTQNFIYGDQKRNQVGELIGGQALPIGVTLTAAILSGGNPAVAGTVGTGYYARLGAGQEAIQIYNEARSQGKTHTQALALAKEGSKSGFVAGGVEGALGSTFGVGELAKSALKLSKPAVKAVFAASADMGVDAAAAMGAQYYKNTEAIKQGIQRDEFEGLAEEGAAEAVFGLGFQILSKGAVKLKGSAPKVYNQLVTQYGKIRPDIVNTTVDEAVKNGEINADAANQLKTDLGKSYVAQEKLAGVEMPEDKQADVVDMQVKIDELEGKKENASPAVLPGIEKQIEDLSGQLQVTAGIPLNEKEKVELNKLQTARDENKAYDKDRLKILEKRQEVAETKGKEIANDKAKELGYSSATHLLNKVKKEGLGEFDTVQEVPQEILDQVNKNKPPMPKAETTEGETKTETDAVQEQTTTEGVLRDTGLRGEGELQGVEQQNQPETVAEESSATTEERKVTPIEGLPDLSLEEANTFIDQHAVQGKIDKYVHRPHFGLSSEELSRGVKQIKEGKTNMAAAKKVLSKIQEWKQQGYVDVIAGGGGTKYAMEKVSIPFELVTEAQELSPENLQEVGKVGEDFEANRPDIEKLVAENYTNEDGSLNVEKLATELEEVGKGFYFGDLLALTENDINELKALLNEERNRTTEEVTPKGKGEVISQTNEADIFSRATDKAIRMAERDKILEEGFGEQAEKAKFVFKNFKNIIRSLEQKGKVTLEGDCF